MAEFGDKFRSARNAKGITIEQVAQETRISVRFLRAIENEEFQTLPGGLFTRGFIRNYATKVGLDPEEAVREYETLNSEVPAEASVLNAQAAIEQRDRYVAPLAVSGLVVLIVLFYVFDLRNAQPPANPEAEVPLVTATPTAESPEPAAVPLVPPEPARTETVRLPVESEAEEPQSPGPGVIVQIQVKEATWLLVQADGTEEEFLLDPGTSQSYTADESLGLRIGNAAGITLNWNGQEFDNLGGDGQVLILNITPDGIGGLADNQEPPSATGPSA